MSARQDLDVRVVELFSPEPPEQTILHASRPQSSTRLLQLLGPAQLTSQGAFSAQRKIELAQEVRPLQLMKQDQPSGQSSVTWLQSPV